MKRIAICVSIIILGYVTFNFSSHAGEVDINKKLGIGLQRNYPLLGGISLRYYGLSPVYLQVAGRFVMDNYDRDRALGAGVSYAVLEHVGFAITRLYFSLQAGGRYEKEVWTDVVFGRQRVHVKKTYGVGVAFGTEITHPFFGTQLGWNGEIGQGFGRIEEHSLSRDTGSFIFSFILGSGIHVYF